MTNLHRDERGVIEMVLPNAEHPITSVARIVSASGARRANHYHKTTGHYCVLMTGRMRYYERPVGSTEIPRCRQIGPGEVFWTGPMLEHLMVFETPGEMWCFGTGARDQKDYEADLVRLEFQLDDVSQA